MSENELDFLEAACTVCHRYKKTQELYLCDSCQEPVCEEHSEDGEHDTRYCTDCIALSAFLPGNKDKSRMDKQEQAKQNFIQAMSDLYPDNELVQQSANQAQDSSLNSIVNAMIMGIATHPEYDALIPALQEAMDVLRESCPDTNESAKKTVMSFRIMFSSPDCLPPVILRDSEDPSQVQEKIFRHVRDYL